jgi:3-deoxy-D-manno-octulosonic-acid transferase
VWIHAVSVGETRAAQPLIQALLALQDQHNVLLTHMTPTGRATGQTLYAKAIDSGRLVQAYLPYDYSFSMRWFMKRWRPKLAIMMETEVWPNLIAVANECKLPIALVNARLSEKSLNKGLRVEGLMRHAVQGFDAIIAQSQLDADRIQKFLPKVNVHVAGNLKFDVVVPAQSVALGLQWKALIDRPTIVFASSRDGEEALFFQAMSEKLKTHVGIKPLVIVVPRHPERFDEVQALAVNFGFSPARRSQGLASKVTADVLLGDSMGEMFAYYSAATVAIIGGSFGAYGSQNLLEAMAVGCPVIVGPSRFNFDHIIVEALQSRGAIGVQTMSAAIDEAFNILQSNGDGTRIGEAGKQFCAAHQGATRKTIQGLGEWLL